MKFRSQFQVSNEVIRQQLGIPDTVSLHYITYDHDREIATLHLSSESEVPGYTVPTHEAQNIQKLDGEGNDN
jgi:hypothetical protein